MIYCLRFIFFQFIIRPLVTIVIGLNVRRIENLPKDGPAIIVANHNSHLDTMVLMSIFPIRLLKKLRPAAAADYFCRNVFINWFSTKIIGIIPVDRSKEMRNPIARVVESIREGDIVIFYPEGTRGEAQKMERLKPGIARLSEKFPDVPIYPVYLYGLGKSLPKGEAILVPFFCDVFVGKPILWTGTREKFMLDLQEQLNTLEKEGNFQSWE